MMPPKKITNVTTPEQQEKNLLDWDTNQKKLAAEMIEKQKRYIANLTKQEA